MLNSHLTFAFECVQLYHWCPRCRLLARPPDALRFEESANGDTDGWAKRREPQAGAWRLIGNSVEEFAGWRRVVSLELGVIKKEMRQNLVRGYQVNGGRTALNDQRDSSVCSERVRDTTERVVIKTREVIRNDNSRITIDSSRSKIAICRRFGECEVKGQKVL